MTVQAPIDRISATAYEIPTDAPEADGTLRWNKTTLVVANVSAAGRTGLGYTYSDASITGVITGKLAEVLHGMDALAIPSAHQAMLRAIRNLGRAGLVATAISAA